MNLSSRVWRVVGRSTLQKPRRRAQCGDTWNAKSHLRLLRGLDSPGDRRLPDGQCHRRQVEKPWTEQLQP